MSVLFHGLRKWENSVELGHLFNSPASGGCSWWPPPLPPPVPEDSSLKAHNLALGHLPKPTEMPPGKLPLSFSTLPHLPWFKCPESPGRACCAGYQKVREDHRRQQPSCPRESWQKNMWDQLLNAHTKKAEDWKCHFAASWQESPCSQGATASDGGRAQTSFFTHTSHLL